MTELTKNERLRSVVKKGTHLLQEEKNYNQITIQRKLTAVGKSVAPATLHNILHDKPVALPTLQTAADGIKVVVLEELVYRYDMTTNQFVPDTESGQQPAVIELPESGEKANSGFIIHKEGRLGAAEKAIFMAGASREIIEIGLRLNSFASYFTSLKEQEYKNHIIVLLRKGVNIKVYLLDPKTREADLYFNDRSKSQPSEKNSIQDIMNAIERLKEVATEFENMKLTGTFEIYTYQHFPSGMFLIVDGGRATGKMLVSHYLFGMRRAHCPVMEFTKADQSLLFSKYWESVQLFIEGAKRVK